MDISDQISKTISEILSAPANPQEDLYRENIEDLRQARKQRKIYATVWSCVVIGQLFIINVFFGYAIFAGKIDPSTLRIFVSATLLEAFGVVYIITKSLFPIRRKE